MSTWICKASAAVLTILALAACGGGGGGGGTGTITPDGPGGPSKIFLADQTNAVVFSSVNVNPAPGVLKLNRTISGSAVTNPMPDIAYDTVKDLLFVGHSTSIAIIEHASTANGNAATVQTISGPFANITSMYLDTRNDRLYVTDSGAGILVFDVIGLPAGAVTLIHTITIKRGAAILVPDEVFVDTNNNVLYAKSPVPGGGGVAQSISIFDNALTRDGQNLVTQELTFPVGANVRGIVGDAANDRLYVVNSTAGTIMVFNGASGAQDPDVPARTIDTNPIILEKIRLVPSANRLYGIAAGQQSLYIINGASAAAGPVSVTVVTNPTVASFTALDVGP
jgi:hypothetical protein